MFTEKMIAPCGLDCSLCSAAHLKENPCRGCLGPDENKPEFCAKECKVIQCEKRFSHDYQFCDECKEFPCDYLVKLENRYMTEYPLKESPLANLRFIREKGMAAFLHQEKDLWTCKVCGGVISVHNGICSNCGKSVKES